VSQTSTSAARSDTRVIRIGTRASELARRQAHQVQAALASRGIASSLVPFTTTGDRDTSRPLAALGARGLFTRELEVALLDGQIDCAVHSLKDLPTDTPPRLAIVSVLAREDPRDALVVGASVVSRPGHGLDLLPAGARVGTSSLRRRAQLRAARSDVSIVELRGNVPTRLQRLDEGRADVALLAAAGLHRLELHSRVRAYLEPPAWLPAPGQGAIALQARDEPGALRAALASLNDDATWIATRAERAFLAALDGGCQVPIGALVLTSSSGSLEVHGFLSDLVGGHALRGSRPVDPARPEDAGVALARALEAQGAPAILAQVREAAARDLPVPEPH
jgi:hydroxymethylbilane synthase